MERTENTLEKKPLTLAHATRLLFEPGYMYRTASRNVSEDHHRRREILRNITYAETCRLGVYASLGSLIYSHFSQ